MAFRCEKVGSRDVRFFYVAYFVEFIGAVQRYSRCTAISRSGCKLLIMFKLDTLYSSTAAVQRVAVLVEVAEGEGVGAYAAVQRRKTWFLRVRGKGGRGEGVGNRAAAGTS